MNEKRNQSDIDPVTLEVLWSRMRGIPREMGTHLSRTAFSAVIKYARDFSTGLFTADGRLLSQGVYAPGHLGSMPFMLRKILGGHFKPNEWSQGDVVLTNDPYINSGHLPDMFMFMPVFLDEDIIGFCVIGGHQLDIGGAGAASYAMHVSDMFAEGIQIPPVKLYKEGELNEDILDIIKENSREPQKIKGDLQAQYGAIRVGHDLYLDLVDEHGYETVNRYMEEIIDRSESRMRTAIGEIPDGTYRFEDKLDGFDEPLPIHAEVTVDESEIEVNFTGSADQIPGHAINSPWQYTFAYTMLAIKSVVDPDSPQTHGAVEPVTMNAPEGSILNARRPVPVASRQIICDRVISTVTGALNRAVPQATPAPGGQPHRQMFKFEDSETGNQQVLFDGHYGGAGARPDRDGFPAVSGSNNLRNTPVEAIEAEYPLRIVQYQLEPNSGGSGEYRGGSGTVREYELLEQAEIQFVNERFKYGPFGVHGGNDGRSGGAVYNPDGSDERSLSSKELLNASEGDVIRVYTPGGGGFGDPEVRDPKRVRRDFANGFISREQASETYGYKPTDAGESTDAVDSGNES